MLKIISDENMDIPEGFRNLSDEEIIGGFLSLDLSDNFTISKNEWMVTFIKMLANDIPSLEKDGADSIMDRIKELSDEFDKYDVDGNKYLDYEEYKNIVTNNVFISES